MSTITPILPRDCYTSSQVARIFGCKNEDGQIKPISRATICRWRRQGYIDAICINSRRYLYTKASVHRFISQTNQSLPQTHVPRV